MKLKKFGFALIFAFIFISSSNIITPYVIAQNNPEILQTLSDAPIIISIATQTEFDINESIFAYIAVIDTDLGEIIRDPEIVVSFTDENKNPLRTFLKDDLTNNNGLFIAKFSALGTEGNFYVVVEASHNGQNVVTEKFVNLGEWKNARMKADLEFIQLYGRVSGIEINSQAFKVSSLKTMRILDAFKESLELYGNVRPVIDTLKKDNYHIFYLNISGVQKSIPESKVLSYYNQIHNTVKNLTVYGIQFDEKIINNTKDYESILSNNLSFYSINESSNNSIIFNLHGEVFPVPSTRNNNTLLAKFLIQFLLGTMALKFKWGFFGEPLYKIGYENGTTLLFNNTGISKGMSGWEWIGNNTETDLNSFEQTNKPIIYQRLDIGEKISNLISEYSIPSSLNISKIKVLPMDIVVLKYITPIFIDTTLLSPLAIFQNMFFSIAFSTLNGTDDGKLLSSLVIGILINLFDELTDESINTYSSIAIDISSYYPDTTKKLYSYISQLYDIQGKKNYTNLYSVLNKTSYLTAYELVPIYNESIQILDQNLKTVGDTSANVSIMYEGLKILGRPYCFMSVMTGIFIGGAVILGIGAALIFAGYFPLVAFLKPIGIALVIAGLVMIAVGIIGNFMEISNYVSGIFTQIGTVIESVRVSIESTIRSITNQVSGIVSGSWKTLQDTATEIANRGEAVFNRLGELWGDLAERGIVSLSQINQEVISNLQSIDTRLTYILTKFSDNLVTLTSDINLITTNLIPRIMGEISTIQKEMFDMQELMTTYMRIGFTEIQDQINILTDEMVNLRKDFGDVLLYIFNTISNAPKRSMEVLDITRSWWKDIGSEIGYKINNVFQNIFGESSFFQRSYSILPYTENTFSYTRKTSSDRMGVLNYVYKILGKNDDLFYQTDQVIIPIQDGVMADTGLRLTLTPTMIKKGENLFIYVKQNEQVYDPKNIDVHISTPNSDFNVYTTKIDNGTYKLPLAGLDLGEYIVTITIENSTVSTKINIMEYNPGLVISPLIIIAIILGIAIGVIFVFFIVRRYLKKEVKISNRIIEIKW